MATLAPRAVTVTRPSDYERLLDRHATRDQARFFLESRGQDLDAVHVRHQRQRAAIRQVQAAIPVDWRRARVNRDGIDRFLFGPEDVIIVVGQDGLVANVAKYLNGQIVLGVNPEPDRNAGVLVPLSPDSVAALLPVAGHGDLPTEDRRMVRAVLDDGQEIVALNEIFVGHRSHQSARYRLTVGGRMEPQSSSGIIVTTGTGATGWARSIGRDRGIDLSALGPADDRLAVFVREAFPGAATGTELSFAVLEGPERAAVRSEMNDGGVIFGDGIEQDYLPFDWGREASLSLAAKHLRLARPV